MDDPLPGEKEEGDIHAVISSLGWQSLGSQTKDTRDTYQLAPTRKLAKRNSEDSKHGHGLNEAGWTINGVMRKKEEAQHVSRDQVEAKFLERALRVAKAPEADEARAALAQENPELLRRMEDAQDSLQRRMVQRQRQMDRLGVFSKDINEIRAKAMYRVALRRKLQSNDLRRKKEEKALEEKPAPDVSLESQLLNILDDIDAIDAPKQTVEESELAAMAASAAVAARKVAIPPEVLEARRRETDQAITDMVLRYRSKVEERRTLILSEMGIDMSMLESGNYDPTATNFAELFPSFEAEEDADS
eukprot:CAMPEP_0170154486 /NCGR_PEP_ID=MMETSP0033_2-20121228/58048_1 /TAXON_ID=195969 /ORGANISM="Dolichomastix tenuilepis, Strain CCMP3274" /LENGTH=302 /DNA_ID=CAMNT_0010391737 /DNA_START=53 /DNA_END=958 /DNA_ORIENTATION=-